MADGQDGEAGRSHEGSKRPPQMSKMNSQKSSQSSKDNLLVSDLADQQTENQHKNLVQSKDRGQFTSTTAMSVLNIAVLKQIVDQGRENYRYYDISLAIIGLSLLLQFIIGLMSLLISNRRSFLEKYGEDSKQSLCINICHCKLVRRKRKHRVSRKTQATSPRSSTSINTTDEVVVMDALSDDEDLCCPYKCTTKVHKKYEDDLIDKYEEFIPELIHTELEMVRARQEMEQIQKKIDSTKKQILKLEKIINDTDEKDTKKDEAKSELEAIEAVLEQYHNERWEKEEFLVKGKIEHSQSKLMYKYVETIIKNRVLKNTTFWQNCINYLLYIIFVLNALITGLGIANPSSPAPAVLPPNVSASI